MKPSVEELEELRADALEDPAFRASMRASAACAARWTREHRTTPSALVNAIARFTRLFPGLAPDSNPTRGEHFPLL